jgi:endonuclease/exonuclease/phosphatase family metal-dependent hydrolase
MEVLRVVTFNLLSPEHADWPSRRTVIEAELRRLRPDLVALQECVRDTGQDQVIDLVGEDYEIVWHSARSDDGVGAALASRWPIGAVREVDLHVTPRVSLPWAAAVLAEVTLPDPFGATLVVHHKPTYEIGFGLERELQAVATARAVEEYLSGRERHVVALGDFDDTPDSAAMRFWTGRQSLDGISVAYRDAWEAVHADLPGHTFAADNPLTRAGEMALELGRRIDYVLVRCGTHGPSLDILDCRLLLDAAVNGVWASDHYAVLAELAVPTHRPGAWIPPGFAGG